MVCYSIFMTENETLAYLAGLFDGEGSLSIQVMDKPSGLNFSPKMTVSLKYGWEEPLELLQKTFGGKIYTSPSDASDSGNAYRWNLGVRVEIEKAAKALYPYLRIKKEICERFLYALSLFPENSRKGVDLYHGNRGWTRETEFEVAQIAYTLNPGTGKRIARNKNRLNELCSKYGVDATITSLEGQVNDISI